MLNERPKSVQSQEKDALHEISMEETREDAFKAFDRFGEIYVLNGARYSKAWKCAKKGKEELFVF